jgi:DNA-binding NtrC family response regulator
MIFKTRPKKTIFAHCFTLNLSLSIMNKKVILCVDDEPIILKSLKAELAQNFGSEYLVETAESAEEALEILEDYKSQKVDTMLVISDWLMPNMKGDELLMQVHLKYPKTGKIMLSGQADASAIERVRSEANGAFISKPWTKETLRKAIAPHLV